MTIRAALYARYSSDQQRAASIEDQFRVCRERAEREGWTIAGTYKDSAISGDSVILLPGIQGLIEDARRSLFEVVVAEALDRVSRDQADVAILYKHLRFAGVPVVTLAEGEIDELHVGLKGTMNALTKLTALLAAVPADLPDIYPNVAAIYGRKVERLAEALKRPDERAEAADAIRGLIERIVLTPGEGAKRCGGDELLSPQVERTWWKRPFPATACSA